MKQIRAWGFRMVAKSIRDTYGFMLERGYEVISVEDYDLGWQAVLKKQDVLARIIQSRGEEEIYFRAGIQAPDDFTDVGSVIYAATGDKIPRWESSDPKVIERYLDRIETYLKNEYVQNPDSLRAAREEYYAAFAQREVVLPSEPDVVAGPNAVPEPRVIPVLYYPLMGMILLLLFGALTTLYAVLLDRMFSAFSVEADVSGMLTGVISLLFALGTMFFFWRRRKKG